MPERRDSVFGGSLGSARMAALESVAPITPTGSWAVPRPLRWLRYVRAILTMSPLAASTSTIIVSNNPGSCPGSRPRNVTSQTVRSSDVVSSASTLSGSKVTS